MKQSARTIGDLTPVGAIRGSRRRIKFDAATGRDSHFTLRRTGDGRFDVICMKCFLTAGSSFREADIETIERRHQCDPSLMVDVMHHCSTC